jgi:hypothetical protein
MKFQKGDLITCKEGTIPIWVKPGKTYEVLGFEIQPPEPGNKCYRDCGHPMHDPKPEMVFVIVDGEKGRCTIYEGCFELDYYE